MIIFKTVTELKERLKHLNGIGFIPTMGALHEGHVALITRSLTENNITVVSIFVNPTQFNDPNDFEKYPLTLEEDILRLERLKVHYLFLPEAKEIYFDNYTYKVIEQNLSEKYCGRSRPGHFDGVLTVVLKLFNIVKPNRVYFGEKDYQQMLLIKKMIEAFFLDIELISVPTVRTDHLALSSRNKLLSDEGLRLAKRFAKLLKEEKDVEKLKAKLQSMNILIDYIEDFEGRRLAAVKIDGVRLIDNVEL